jgi:hypothetical protein
MNKIKKDLLSKIEKNAQKIRDKRVIAANNKTLEDAVFDFFRNIDGARDINGIVGYHPALFARAKESLTDRLKTFDSRVKVAVEFNAPEDPSEIVTWNNQQVRGVTIWWSRDYLKKNNVDPSYYVDISQMLFI